MPIMKKNLIPVKRSYVYLLWYGDTLELCSSKIKVCYNFVCSKLSDRYQEEKKSYSQVARDIQNHGKSIMLTSYTNRYKIERKYLHRNSNLILD